MLEDARGVLAGQLGEVEPVGWVEERVSFSQEKGLVGVHAAAVLAEEGLGHEGGVDPVLSGHFLHRDSIGLGVVGHAKGFVVTQIDFVLTGCDLVVAVFHLDPHLLQGKNGLASQIVSPVQGRHVEVAAPVDDFGGGIRFEIEVFQLRTHVKGEAFLRRLPQHAFQYVPGISLVGTSVGIQDVAEHSSHGLFPGTPRKKLKGRGIGNRHHVAFLDAGEPFDGGSVKAHPFTECQGQFVRGHGKALELSQDIGEPQLDERHLFLFGQLQNVLRRMTQDHSSPPWARNR